MQRVRSSSQFLKWAYAEGEKLAPGPGLRAAAGVAQKRALDRVESIKY